MLFPIVVDFSIIRIDQSLCWLRHVHTLYLVPERAITTCVLYCYLPRVAHVLYLVPDGVLTIVNVTHHQYLDFKVLVCVLHPIRVW